MPNQNYNRGAEYERGVVRWLVNECNALYATRTPGSKSPVDVIAVFAAGAGHVKTHLIQCKKGSSPPKRSEIDYLKFMREKGCAAYFVAPRKDRRFKQKNEKGETVTVYIKRKEYCSYVLESVEAGALGPVRDDGKKEDADQIPKKHPTKKNRKK